MPNRPVAIAEIGETHPVRNSDKGPKALVVETIEAALADAGIEPKDVGGFVSDGLSMPSTVPVIGSLRNSASSEAIAAACLLAVQRRPAHRSMRSLRSQPDWRRHSSIISASTGGRAHPHGRAHGAGSLSHHADVRTKRTAEPSGHSGSRMVAHEWIERGSAPRHGVSDDD